MSQGIESQQSVAAWGEEAFGPVSDARALVDRAMTEMAELREAVGNGETDESAAEAADVVILLYRLAATQGFDLAHAVDDKMRINRARRWRPAGDGTGQHLP